MRTLIPLGLFLLGLAGIYVGTLQAAFTALMRLPLRLSAERNGANETLQAYLDEPRLFFVPARLLLGIILVLGCQLSTVLFGIGTWRGVGVLALSIIGFVIVCEHFLPQLIVRRNPRAVLTFLLPSFRVLASPLHPLMLAILGLGARSERETGPPDTIGLAERAPGTTTQESAADAEDGERRMLQSIVDFGEILVREIMTPRPDIVAVRSDATVAEVRDVFREQQYSRIPVYKDNLDNIVGIVFVKDLLLHDEPDAEAQPVTALMRPATFVPETKRVPELLKEFQRKQVQAAIVVDEYGGTAGLVTIEDMLEEIVGEIRDEYDVESEPIVDEGGGVFVVSAKVDIDEVAERLEVPIEREGFETVGGFVVSHLGRVPAPGERLTIGDIGVEVLEAERRRVHKVRLRRAVGAES
jgi:CBS domain containing-hemolysin-like protein